MAMPPMAWQVTGSYYEVCNCEAICPCRRQGDRKGGRSTYGTCDFALSWLITEGRANTRDLGGLSVVMAGRYSDDEPGEPWRVVLYVDERGDAEQQRALADIFLGRAGGVTLRNYAQVIGEVYAVRPAHIALDHTPNAERIAAGGYLSAHTARPVLTEARISCGIPGHDAPGQEIVAEHFAVDDPPLRWAVSGRCGFATAFAYQSDER
ncbi:MAG TPA: DUF1326 domain-containing protein [Gemmatirosa sp.]